MNVKQPTSWHNKTDKLYELTSIYKKKTINVLSSIQNNKIEMLKAKVQMKIIEIEAVSIVSLDLNPFSIVKIYRKIRDN